MSRPLRTLIALLLVPLGCATTPSGSTLDPRVAQRLPAMLHALDSASPGDRVQVFRFRVDGPDGRWDDEVVTGANVFAERRTRFDGEHYAFGEGTRGAWLRVGDAPLRAATAGWLREERTRRALFALRFLSPTRGDAAELLTATAQSWEYAFQPAGGHTLTFDVNADDTPASFDSLDDFGRLVVCEDVQWARNSLVSVIENAECHTSGRSYEFTPRPSAFRLLSSTSRARADLPAWLAADEPCVPSSRFEHETEIEPEQENQITVDMVANGVRVPLVLDSGAFHTVLDAETARRLRAVPTGEAPMFLRPPWLPSGETWVAVLDHVDIAGVPVDGMHVLVMEGLGVTGLVGLDFFRRAVVDVDMPHGVVRFVPPERFEMPAGARVANLFGDGSRVDLGGEVVGVGCGSFTLDTGMMDTVVVYGSAMAGMRPRTVGSDEDFGIGRDDAGGSPDYVSAIDGLRFAGLRFPPMPATGRDRDTWQVGTGLALVGMGVMRHVRTIFDLRDRRLIVVPGDGYVALNAFGITVDDEDGRPVVSQVSPGSSAEFANVRLDDRIVRVDGVPVSNTRDARAALARAARRTVHVRLMRDNVEFTVSIEPRASR